MKATIDPIDSLTNWDGTDHFISNLCTDTITTSPLLLLLLQLAQGGCGLRGRRLPHPVRALKLIHQSQKRTKTSIITHLLAPTD